MKKLLVAALLLFPFTANAQTALQNYPAGFRLIDGTQLNKMVAAVNNIQGNGTASNIKLGNGTVALPSLAFGSDTDTGIYRIGANNLGVAANGAKVLDVGTTGLAVTGLLSATTTLAVTGASTFTGAVNANGHVNTGATPPALTSCGGGSPAITGSDTAGIVTMGTSATGCVITFATAYTGTPYCVVSWIATPLASQSYATSNTAITITQTSTSSNKLQYVCHGPSGG